jgi:ADP-ribosylglycohydrolase
MNLETVKSAMLGLAVGDALGVPVEFRSRDRLDKEPVTGMRAYGTHQQPAGTWSDDTSMALCLLKSLTQCGVDCGDMMARFFRWADEGYMTAHGKVFDMGISTQKALSRYGRGTPPLECGSQGQYDNGNGSLMRILPMALYLHCRFGPEFSSKPEAYELIHQASRVTHAHPISQISCGIYCAIANEFLCGHFAPDDMQRGIAFAKGLYAILPEFAPWLEQFGWVDVNVLRSLPRERVRSDGFVIHTLEAALWCLLAFDSYKDCLLAAVNLGDDTDTTGAAAGGLAGIRWGWDSIPAEWLQVLARRGDIEALCCSFWNAAL